MNPDLTEQEMVDILTSRGYGVIPPSQYMIDLDEPFRRIWSAVSPYTMTSIERGYSLYKAVEYTLLRNIPGDFVECGVWKGGSCMLMALTLKHFGIEDRRIRLYDTFTGMTEPGDEDVIAWNGKPVSEKWESDRRGETNNFTGWSVSLENVKKNILTTGYPEEMFDFVEGPVEQTLPARSPAKISLLRLDTDWYESTRVELEILYPKLASGGVLIIDDYGHFSGARKAVDEFFSESAQPIMLNRVDYTGRTAIKTEKTE